METRYITEGKLDARFLNLVRWGRVPGATDEERELAELLGKEGLGAVKAKLGLPQDTPVIPLVIDAPSNSNSYWGRGRKTTSK